MNDIALATFSNLMPENMRPSGASQSGFIMDCTWAAGGSARSYEVRSNRESGYGRYDVILIPEIGSRCYDSGI